MGQVQGQKRPSLGVLRLAWRMERKVAQLWPQASCSGSCCPPLAAATSLPILSGHSVPVWSLSYGHQGSESPAWGV